MGLVTSDGHGGLGSLRAGMAALVAVVLAGCAVVAPQPGVTQSVPPQTPKPSQSAATRGDDPELPAAPAASFAALPTTQALTAAVGKVSAKGIATTGIVVIDPATDTVLLSQGDVPMVPASTMKVLTTLAALDTMGAEKRFATTAVLAGSRLTLVGGGDPMLTDKQSTSASKGASLEGLAAQVAAALKQSGVTKVTLDWDTSLFTGSSWNDDWPESWKTFTVPVTALSVNGGRVDRFQAHKDPAKTAAEAFAKRLTAAGVTATLGQEHAAGKGKVVGTVESAPLTELIGAILRTSDNHAADVLARQVAVATGAAPSFDGARKAVTSWLRERGLWAEGMVVRDGSGLSKKNLVAPSVLAKAISTMLIVPSLAAVGKGLPVAGVSGTLKDRFDDPSEAAGRETVHAKTGTLAGVATLAGYLVDAEGVTLVFVAMANQSVGQNTAYNWLDRTAAALAGCGCR